MAPVMLTPVLKIYLISEWSKDIYEFKEIHFFFFIKLLLTVPWTLHGIKRRRMVSLRYRLKDGQCVEPQDDHIFLPSISPQLFNSGYKYFLLYPSNLI